jgi:hypothetical protein
MEMLARVMMRSAARRAGREQATITAEVIATAVNAFPAVVMRIERRGLYRAAVAPHV